MTQKILGCEVGRRLGYGISRYVHELGPNWVVKFARLDNPKIPFQWTRGANLSEAQTCETAKLLDDGVEFLCPVIAVHPDGDWLVMERCATILGSREQDTIETLSVSDEDQWRECGADVALIHAMLDIFAVSDIHTGNIGILADGRQVYIDYAT